MRGSRRRLLGALVLLVVAAVPAAAARAQRPAAAALAAWRGAVQGGAPEAIAALLPVGAVVLFRVTGHPKLPAELRLSGAELLVRLKAGDARALGLHKDLLLPTAKDLRKDVGGRYRASNAGCPEVTWIFAPAAGGRWALVEVQRKFLEC